VILKMARFGNRKSGKIGDIIRNGTIGGRKIGK
jgi:hypothetical protein